MNALLPGRVPHACKGSAGTGHFRIPSFRIVSRRRTKRETTFNSHPQDIVGLPAPRRALQGFFRQSPIVLLRQVLPQRDRTLTPTIHWSRSSPSRRLKQHAHSRSQNLLCRPLRPSLPVRPAAPAGLAPPLGLVHRSSLSSDFTAAATGALAFAAAKRDENHAIGARRQTGGQRKSSAGVERGKVTMFG